MLRARSLALTLLGLLTLSAPLACGADAPPVTLAVRDGDGARSLDRAALEQLNSRELTVDEHTYAGARVRDVLGRELAEGQTLVVRGADGYTQTIAPAVANGDDTIVALTRDGAALPAGEGPARIVALGSPGLSVRQLVELRVE